MLDNGDVIFSDEDFKKSVTESLGFEAGEYVQYLINKGDEAYQEAKYDFSSCEMKVEKQSDALLKIQHILTEMKGVEPDKRARLANKISKIVSANV
jgi:hypothetical protein